jgi:hypothetical protein
MVTTLTGFSRHLPRLLTALPVIAIAFAAPQTAAAAVIYSEAVSGDADIFGPPTLNLALGDNDILGSVSDSFFADGVDGDFDAYSLVVGAGTRITSILFTSMSVIAGNGEFTGITWRLQGASSAVGTQVRSANTPAFAAALPLGAGTYILDTETFETELEFGQFSIVSYAIRVTVEATPTTVPDPAVIPLPAGAGLLAASLGLLAVLRRRRT